MKPLKGDQQLRSVSLYSGCAPGVRTKILSTKKKGLDASNDRGLTERSGEVFLLDILSHRMSVMVISSTIIEHRRGAYDEKRRHPAAKTRGLRAPQFRSLLPRVLKECALGRWGLFGQNDGADGSKYLFWSVGRTVEEYGGSKSGRFGKVSESRTRTFNASCTTVRCVAPTCPENQDWRNRCWMNLNLAPPRRPSRSQRA